MQDIFSIFIQSCHKYIFVQILKFQTSSFKENRFIKTLKKFYFFVSVKFQRSLVMTHHNIQTNPF